MENKVCEKEAIQKQKQKTKQTVRSHDRIYSRIECFSHSPSHSSLTSAIIYCTHEPICVYIVRIAILLFIQIKYLHTSVFSHATQKLCVLCFGNKFTLYALILQLLNV